MLPWFRIVGGGGIRAAPRRDSTYTASPCTSPYDGYSSRR